MGSCVNIKKFDHPSILWGVLVMVLGMIILASTDAVSKYLTLSFAVIQILWIRYMVFALIGSFLVLKKSGVQGLRTKRPIAQVVRALILTGTNFMAVLTLSLMPMADAHAILAIAPLMVTAVSAPILGEVIGQRRWIAVSVAFAGVLIILRPGVGVFDPVSLIPLAVAVSFSAYTVLTKVISRDDENETTLFYTGVIGLISLTTIGPFFWIQPDPIDWFWLLLAAVLGSMAHVFIITALHLAPASVLQPFNYTMLVWATLLGYLIFNNLPDVWTVLGALTIVASGLFVCFCEWAEQKNKKHF